MINIKQMLAAMPFGNLTSARIGIPWFEIAGDVWRIGRKVMRGFSNEGMYQVLDYEATLVLHDRGGKKATFMKRKKVRYLQDNIVAYQDHAWGEGQILLNYRSSPGKAVDQYRSGHKTLVLLSLQEVKSKGDIDEFNIRWDMRNGFLSSSEFWTTDIPNKTNRVRVRVNFPKSRRPRRLTLVEANRKRTHILGSDAVRKLADGRWLVTWKKWKPKLYERYVLNWEW